MEDLPRPYTPVTTVANWVCPTPTGRPSRGGGAPGGASSGAGAGGAVVTKDVLSTVRSPQGARGGAGPSRSVADTNVFVLKGV